MVGLKIVQGVAAVIQNALSSGAVLRPCSFIVGLANCIDLGGGGGGGWGRRV